MTDKPAPTNPTLLNLLGKAAVKAGTDNDDLRMKAAGERALALAQKAMREGKAGLVTDGKGTFAIVER
jgi:hypothetical protein